MTESVQRLWERALLGGLVWAFGVAVALWGFVGLGGGWGAVWGYVGLVVGAVGGAHVLVGLVGVGVKLGREAAELD